MSGKRSNTAGNTRKATGKPFQKDDPRINRKGRPKSFDAFRELAVGIAQEKIKKACSKIGIVVPNDDAGKLRVAEFILRKWALSNDPKLQIAFTEIAFGKVREVHELTGANGQPLIPSQTRKDPFEELAEICIKLGVAFPGHNGRNGSSQGAPTGKDGTVEN